MPEPKKHFTQAFRDEAVGLVQTSGRSRREVAADLGIGLSTLRNWINARRGRAMDEPPPDRQEDMVAELKRLRREKVLLQRLGRVGGDRGTRQIRRQPRTARR